MEIKKTWFIQISSANVMDKKVCLKNRICKCENISNLFVTKHNKCWEMFLEAFWIKINAQSKYDTSITVTQNFERTVVPINLHK